MLIRLFVLLMVSLPAIAQMTDKINPTFNVDPEVLKNGEVHYFVGHYDRAGLKKLRDFSKLDGGRLLKRKGVRVELSKLAYLVNRPAGFFSSTQMTDAQWLGTFLGTNVKPLQEDTFETQSRGKMRVYFDSDDLSSVRSSRFVHAVSQSKRLDPIALGGFSTVVLHSANQVEIHNHIPYTPKQTLVVSYYLKAVSEKADVNKLRLDFTKETEARLIRSYP